MACAALLTLGGCGVQTAVRSGPGDSSPAPAVALKAVYELEGQQRQVIFLDAENLTDEELDEIMDDLEAQLDVEVLPAEDAFRGDPELPALTPVDPQSGTVGVSLTLGEITEVADQQYEATVFYARSGLDGGEVTLVLGRQGSRWAVLEHFSGPQS